MSDISPSGVPGDEHFYRWLLEQQRRAAASAVSASSSATSASAAKIAAEAALDAFDDRYLGAKASDPLVDNDGDALISGATYWNTTLVELRVYDAGTSQFYGPAVSSVNGLTGAVTIDLLHAEDLSLAPTGSPSVGEGSLYVRSVRTGGNGQYGNALYNYVVEDEIPSGQFDVGVTSWATAENQTGGQIFGSWVGANTPYTGIGHTFTAGGAVGQEINVGNRAADFGLLTDIGTGRWTVGQQIVPDVLPSPDAPPGTFYPGSFAQVISASIHGHKWWTGYLTRPDALMPGGIHWRVGGGSIVGNAALALMSVSGFWTTGIDLTPATISGDAFKSDGFSVSGSGAATVASLTTAGSVSSATVATTGNVSIGGATATARLDVAGTNAAPSLTADVAMFEFTSSTSAQLVGGAYNGGAYPFWLQTKQSNNSGNSFSLHINPLGGNVGIGVAVTDSVTAKLHVNGAIRHASSTVAGLPSASSSGVGSRYLVTDANATTFAAVVAGGGANVVPVYSDGTNWRIG